MLGQVDDQRRRMLRYLPPLDRQNGASFTACTKMLVEARSLLPASSETSKTNPSVPLKFSSGR